MAINESITKFMPEESYRYYHWSLKKEECDDQKFGNFYLVLSKETEGIWKICTFWWLELGIIF